MDEWLRVLKPDGELRIILPNIAWAAQMIVRGVINNDVLNVLYGQQEYRENFHKIGFTPETLKAMLEKRKYKILELKTEGYNILCRATKKTPKKRNPASLKGK